MDCRWNHILWLNCILVRKICYLHYTFYSTKCLHRCTPSQAKSSAPDEMSITKQRKSDCKIQYNDSIALEWATDHWLEHLFTRNDLGLNKFEPKKKNQDAGLMHYLWDKLVLDAESRIEKKIHIFFTSFFFTAASMNPVNINNIAETRKNALTVAIFRLQVRGLKKQFYWLMLQTVYPMRTFDTSLSIIGIGNWMGVLCFQELESIFTRYLWKFSSLLKQFCIKIRPTLICRTHLQLRLLRLHDIILSN